MYVNLYDALRSTLACTALLCHVCTCICLLVQPLMTHCNTAVCSHVVSTRRCVSLPNILPVARKKNTNNKKSSSGDRKHFVKSRNCLWVRCAVKFGATTRGSARAGRKRAAGREPVSGAGVESNPRAFWLPNTENFRQLPGLRLLRSLPPSPRFPVACNREVESSSRAGTKFRPPAPGRCYEKRVRDAASLGSELKSDDNQKSFIVRIFYRDKRPRYTARPGFHNPEVKSRKSKKVARADKRVTQTAGCKERDALCCLVRRCTGVSSIYSLNGFQVNKLRRGSHLFGCDWLKSTSV